MIRCEGSQLIDCPYPTMETPGIDPLGGKQGLLPRLRQIESMQ
jgi:hypothetical protein